VLTKGDCRSLTQRIAYTLRDKFNVGTSTNNYVTCLSSGNLFLPCVFYGVVAAGGIFSSVSASASVKEVAYMIKLASSNLVLCNEDTRDVAVEAAKLCGIPASRVLFIDSQNLDLIDLSNGQKLLSDSKLDWKRINTAKEQADTTVSLIFSSGTTGFPKAVTLSHQNIVAAAVITNNLVKDQLLREKPDFQYRTLAHLPCAHIAGLQGYFINPVYFGGPTYWMPKFDFAKFLEYNKRYRITFFFTVPPIYLLIAKTPTVTDQFDDLQLAISGKIGPALSQIRLLTCSRCSTNGKRVARGCKQKTWTGQDMGFANMGSI
jgi:4-coumarate--CoA ligase